MSPWSKWIVYAVRKEFVCLSDLITRWKQLTVKPKVTRMKGSLKRIFCKWSKKFAGELQLPRRTLLCSPLLRPNQALWLDKTECKKVMSHVLTNLTSQPRRQTPYRNESVPPSRQQAESPYLGDLSGIDSQQRFKQWGHSHSRNQL